MQAAERVEEKHQLGLVISKDYKEAGGGRKVIQPFILQPALHLAQGLCVDIMFHSFYVTGRC